MNELEMEIGRLLGSSAFFIYQTIKHNPNFTAREIQLETGLSEYCVWQNLNKLKDTKIVNSVLKTGTNRVQLYKENEKGTWKLH